MDPAIAAPLKKKPIGELFIEKGLITEDHVKFALLEQKITGEKLGELLERLGFITQYDTASVLAERDGLTYLDLNTTAPTIKALKMFNKNLCLSHLFLPLIEPQDGERKILIACADSQTERLAQLITRQTGCQPTFALAERGKIIDAINKYYYFLENPVEKLIANEVAALTNDTEMARGMDNLIKHLLHYAIKMRTSDIHIRPMGKSISIAFRVDGVLVTVLSLPVTMKRLISAIKLKSGMDIAEQRMPQDGRFEATILNHEYDFRVSTVISPHGENVVSRIHAKDSSILGMRQLGFYAEDINCLDAMFNEPFGIVLLTGPTGSGKSTTLYAGIRCLDLLQKNVLTVENPIELEIPLVRQTQVNEKAGYTFANSMRYFLRHDPDVIMIGEIRDKETAATAFSAATTGHLVLSTLHTNTAIGAIPRLKELGVRTFLIADALLAVVSQRLVRRICSTCKSSYGPTSDEASYLGIPELTKLYRGNGCEACSGKGYLGRTLVYEVLGVDHTLARLIDKDAEIEILLAAAKRGGFRDIFSIATRKAIDGVTSVEEMMRVLGSVRRGGQDEENG